MKKLSLQLGSIKEMLTKEQMKKITGGQGYGPHYTVTGTGIQCGYGYDENSLTWYRCPFGSDPSAVRDCLSNCQFFHASANMCECKFMECHGFGAHNCG